MFAPARTPRAIVAKLNTETNRMLKLPDVRERLRALGVSPLGGSPEELAQYLHFEITRWGRLIKENGIKLK
jgi:tripartite-type tricarboxylate transporter receptor subunit TctC